MKKRKQKYKPSFAKATGGKRGVCRVCGCSHYNPCINKFGQTCGWTDGTQTLCTFCKKA